MKKKITVLAVNQEISLFFKNELENIFKKMFEVDYRSCDMASPLPVIDSDLVLYTDPAMFNALYHLVRCPAPPLMMRRTITREALAKIKALPSGSVALVANLNEYMANETTALFLQLGVTHLNLFPYYKDAKVPENHDYIICPGRYDYMGDAASEIVEIGNRVFDISLVLDILSILQVEQAKSEEIMLGYMAKVPTFWHGIEYAWKNRRVLVNQWRILLNEISSGVLLCDKNNVITLENRKILQVFSMDDQSFVGKSLDHLCTKEPAMKSIISHQEVSHDIVKCSFGELVVSVKTVSFGGQDWGRIIIIDPYTEMMKAQAAAMTKMASSGYASKYSFDSLIGSAPSFLEAKSISKKAAKVDATVLLFGESGTGKELFAGAVHNASFRCKKPFVAVNCATLPENLLETELFGYEGGAFTGARKGGRTGLFELANGGTLFLDEIGDLPHTLQARLLRAIEEKEIRRVGGENIINLDVRVIAATNRNLTELVEKGEFRQDLFYRLNVFQISIPPLRERTGDIFDLINYFLVQQDKNNTITNGFKSFCRNYDWPGNIRELKNVIEYVTTINDHTLSIQTLPAYLKQKAVRKLNKENEDYQLLRLIFNRKAANINTGRRSLKEEFSKKFYLISEMDVRQHLAKLEKDGFVEIHKGRHGTEITDKGVDFLTGKGHL